MFDYYQEKKREEIFRKKRKKKLILVFFIFFIFLGIFFYLFRSDFFQIKVLEVKKKNSNSQQQLIEKKIIYEVFKKELNNLKWPFDWIFSKDNLIVLLFKKKIIIEKITQSFPFLQEIDLNVNFFKKKVTFLIEERNKFALWCKKTKEECFWFDENGIAFLEAPLVEGEVIFKVIDYSENDIRKGERVLVDEDYLSNLISIFYFLDKSEISLKTLELKDLSLAEISTQKLSNLPKIYFSLRHSPLFALEWFKEMKNKFSQIEYIDLTVENKIFYK